MAARRAAPTPMERPLRLAPLPALEVQLAQALGAKDGLGGAHCIHELWMRRAYPGRIEAALEALWQHCARSIPEWLPMRYIEWLPELYEVAGHIEVRWSHGRFGGLPEAKGYLDVPHHRVPGYFELR